MFLNKITHVIYLLFVTLDENVKKKKSTDVRSMLGVKHDVRFIVFSLLFCFVLFFT